MGGTTDGFGSAGVHGGAGEDAAVPGRGVGAIPGITEIGDAGLRAPGGTGRLG